MGKRIKDTDIIEQTQFEPKLRLLVDKMDADVGFPWMQAKNIQLKYLGNTYFQGSTNNVNWHDDIVAADSYMRFSSNGGTDWRDLTTGNVREGNNLYFTNERVLAITDIANVINVSHEHINLGLLENLIDNGTGDSFLTDAGTYFNVLGGLTEGTIPIKGALGFENSPITLVATNIDINGTLTHDTPTLSTESALLGDITDGTRVGKFSSVIATNLTDNFIPYHVSDAAGLADSIIFKDGTSIKIGDSTNNIEFGATGTITLHGSATVYDDVTYDAIALQQTGPGISINNAEGTVNYTTAANQADYMYVNSQMPHARMNGAMIFPHIHFFQAENNIPNFALQYRWQLNGGTKTTAWTAIKCNTPAFTYASGTLNQIVHPVTGITPPVGDNVSDIVQFRVLRDTTNALGLTYAADPYTATVNVIQFDCHIEKDGWGSESEYTK